jgi:hypothetical protein
MPRDPPLLCRLAWATGIGVANAATAKQAKKVFESLRCKFVIVGFLNSRMTASAPTNKSAPSLSALLRPVGSRVSGCARRVLATPGAHRPNTPFGEPPTIGMLRIQGPILGNGILLGFAVEGKSSFEPSI